MIVYDFNRYLLQDPVISGLLDVGDIISPVQEPPEEAGNFLLYEFEKRASEQLWLVQNLAITYEVWSFSYDQAIAIDERLTRLVAADRMASRFFKWRNGANQTAEFGMPCYMVQSLSHTYSGELPPPDEAGGKFGRIIVVELGYTPYDIEPEAI